MKVEINDSFKIRLLIVIIVIYSIGAIVSGIGFYNYGYKQGALNTRRTLTIEQSDTTIKTCQDDRRDL